MLGCYKYILGMGTCHQEGYRFSRYWYHERYKERYRLSRFSIRNISSGMHIRKVGMRSGTYYRKIGMSSGTIFQKIGVRSGHVFETAVGGPWSQYGRVHLAGNVVQQKLALDFDRKGLSSFDVFALSTFLAQGNLQKLTARKFEERNNIEYCFLSLNSLLLRPCLCDNHYVS